MRVIEQRAWTRRMRHGLVRLPGSATTHMRSAVTVGQAHIGRASAAQPLRRALAPESSKRRHGMAARVLRRVTSPTTTATKSTTPPSPAMRARSGRGSPPYNTTMALADRQAAAAADLARAGEANAPVQIIDYDPAWPGSFQAERKRLTPLLGRADIHHIGSTAVPGLAAKPVIDMMALVPDIDAPIAVLVERAGYQFPPAYNATLSHRRWLCYPAASHRTHHLHLVDQQPSLTVTCASATGCARTHSLRVNTPRSSAGSPADSPTTARHTPRPSTSSSRPTAAESAKTGGALRGEQAG